MVMMTRCEKESCLNCMTYDLFEFSGDLNDNIGSFYVCEFDDMWDHIVWKEYNTPGGTLYWFDLHEYTLGYRTVENYDIDNDGIVNENDNDVDNDGIMNLLDKTPYGTESNIILELIVCENP